MKRFVFLFAVGAVCGAFAEEPLHVGFKGYSSLNTANNITNGLGQVVAYQPGLILDTPQGGQAQDGADLYGIIWNAGWNSLIINGDMTLGAGGIVNGENAYRFNLPGKGTEKGLHLTACQRWYATRATSTRQIVLWNGSGWATNAQGVVTSPGGITRNTYCPLFLDPGVTLSVSNLDLHVLSSKSDCSQGTIRFDKGATLYPEIFEGEENALRAGKVVFADGGRVVLGGVINDIFTWSNPTKIQMSAHLDAEHIGKEIAFENGSGITVQSGATVVLGPEKITVTGTAGTETVFPSTTYEQTREIALEVGENAKFKLNGKLLGTPMWTLAGAGTFTFNADFAKVVSVEGFTGTLIVSSGCVRLPAKSTWPEGMTVQTTGTGVIAVQGGEELAANHAAYFVDDTVVTEDIELKAGELLYVEGNGLTANTKVTMWGDSKIYVGETATIAAPIVLTNHLANADREDVHFFGITALLGDVTATISGKVSTQMDDLGYAVTKTTDKLSRLCQNSVLEMNGPGTVVFAGGADWNLVSIKHSKGTVKLTNGTYLPETESRTHQNGYIRIGWNAEKFAVCDGGYLNLLASANVMGIWLSASSGRTAVFEVGNDGKVELKNNRDLRMGYYGGTYCTNVVRLCAGGELLMPDQGGYWTFNETVSGYPGLTTRFEMEGGHLQLGKWMLRGESVDADDRSTAFVWTGGRISWMHSGSNPHIMSRMLGVPVTVAGPNCVVDCGGSSLTNCVATWVGEVGGTPVPWTFTDEGRLVVSNGTFVFNTPIVNANLATVGGATVELMTKRVYSQMSGRADWHSPTAYFVDEENTMTHDVKKLTVLDNAGGTYLAHTESPVVDATLVIAEGGVWPITKTFTNVSWKDLVFADGATLAGTKDTTTTDLGAGTLSFTGTVTTAFASVPSLASEPHPLFKAASVALDGATFTKAPSTSEVSFKTSDTAMWFETKGSLLIFR